MNILRITTIAICVSLFLCSNVLAIGSIGQPTPIIETSNNPDDIPINQWIGKKFYLLEFHRSAKQGGYSNLRKSPTDYYNKLPSLPYENKIATVVDVQQGTDEDSHIVKFIIDSTGEVIYGQAYKSKIFEIAYVGDLEKAKQRWIGKTIYPKRYEVYTYDASTDTAYLLKSVKFVDPLKVIDVIYGLQGTDPFWLIVENDRGEQGFIRTRYSYTAYYNDSWKKGRPWERNFFEENPRETYNWGEEIWSKIVKREISRDMTREQVMMSWGKPYKINSDTGSWGTHEQWVYNSSFLYFENGFLRSWQNR